MAKRVKPGVVSGSDYAAVVAKAKAGKYALPAVNVVGTNTVNAVLEAAAEAKSDVIIQLSNGGAVFYAGKGYPDTFEAGVLGAVAAAQHVHLLAERYGVCVVLHTDHANRKLLPWLDALLTEGEKWFERTGRPLYSSHMIDLSEEPLLENLDTCATFLRRMNKIDMSIEIELGVTGGEEHGVGHDVDLSAENPKLYTQPSEVLEAYKMLNPLGDFSIAASFGNVHGVYKPGNVKLRPEILKASQEMVQREYGTADNPLNLVFHGGSGSEKSKITQAVDYGVFKMNIDTDTQFAFANAVGSYVEENTRAFMHQLDPDDGRPYKKVYDPRKFLRSGEVKLKARLQEAFRDLGAIGTSAAHV